MIPPMKTLALLAPVLCLVSCAGYQLGGDQTRIAGAGEIHRRADVCQVTLHPRGPRRSPPPPWPMPSCRTAPIASPGWTRRTPCSKASSPSIKYTAIRSTRSNTLRPEELANTVSIHWTLRDAKNPTKILASGKSSGTSQFYVAPNLETARNNALPDALERAAEALVSRLASGY